MRIVIFGVGKIYERYSTYISSKDEIVAFIDNNVRIQGEKKNGIEIYSPVEICELSYDEIVIMSNYLSEMRDQLLQLGCSEEDIIPYIEYISRQEKGKMQIYFAEKQIECKKKCLIITSSLGYHGGAITAAYTAMELMGRGYGTVIAAPDSDEQFIKEFSKKGITFCIYPNLEFAKWSEMIWVENFQIIIVNTYPMMLCAVEICKHRKVMVWLHESDVVYLSKTFWKSKIMKNILDSNLYICAVSNVARKTFIRNVAECNINLLPYGIPDLEIKETREKVNLTFAIIGTIHPIKQQLLYLSAIKNLDILEKNDNEFLIIGDDGDNAAYVETVKEEAKKLKNIKVIGGLDKRQLEKRYQDIDVIVVASSQESMSLVATEAMMHEKVCIICDVAGMADFIEHEKNGLIYETNDAESLSRQISYCIKNRKKLDLIGRNARETYCENFTMKIFGDRIEKVIMNIRG